MFVYLEQARDKNERNAHSKIERTEQSDSVLCHIRKASVVIFTQNGINIAI